MDYDSAIRPCLGETLSGDAIYVLSVGGLLVCAIADVLGHGPEAHDLTPAIGRSLERHASGDAAKMIEGMHRDLRGTRGSALGLCVIDTATRQLDYIGVGNTVMRCFGQSETRLVSLDGVLGQNMRTPRPQRLVLSDNDLVLLYTDGVSDRFVAGDYPGLQFHAPAQIATNVVERFGKQHDDAACFALRCAA